MIYYSLEKILEDINENNWKKYENAGLVNTTGLIVEINQQNKYIRLKSNGLKTTEETLTIYWIDKNERLDGIEVGNFVDVVFSIGNNKKCKLMVLKKLG